MKRLLLVASIALAGCVNLPDSAVNAVSQAGGGCVKVNGIWGSGIVIVGSADKGVIRNGELTVAGDCGGITIKDAATVRPAVRQP